jgi:hypothetical protein
MIDFRSFRDEHPELCPQDRLRVPGLGAQPAAGTAELGGWEDAYKGLTGGDPWGDPTPVRPLMQESGAEAFGYPHRGLRTRGRPGPGVGFP